MSFIHKIKSKLLEKRQLLCNVITCQTVKETVRCTQTLAQKLKNEESRTKMEIKSMKTKILQFVVSFCFLGSLPAKTVALNYTIIFTGTGASSTIDSVIVQNLTKSTKVTVLAGNVLNLSDAPNAVEKVSAPNAVEQVSATDETIRVYPASVAGKSMVSFFTRQAGVTQINTYSIDGMNSSRDKH